MAASSPLSSEYEEKNHPFQVLEKPGPKEAYESRQVNGGLYVRIDMPGVPPDGVKLFKRGETHTVTFSGKAPIVWPHFERSGRVYGGYIVLDRNPDEIDVEMTVVNGCLRLFFPAADGVLHFASKKPVPQHFTGVQHMRLRNSEGCYSVEDSDLRRSMYINPFLLAGEAGLMESHATIDQYGVSYTYLRVDMPGLAEKKANVGLGTDVELIFGGEGSQEHLFDEGGRTYAACWINRCTCCKMSDVKHAMKDGVFRASLRRNTFRIIEGCELSLIAMP